MPSPATPPTEPLLRPADRRTATVLTAGVLVLLAAGWWRHRGQPGGVIDVDRAPPLTAQFLVNVNQADWPELIQLPGVGRTLAERLVAEREEHGEFRSVEELTRVDGIGPRTIDRIRPYLSPIADESEVASR